MMKSVATGLLLLLLSFCSCTTTPRGTPEQVRAVRAIFDQENFAYPLSFSESLFMNGKDFADTIESYTAALRKIPLSGAPLEFQAAFQNYALAWDKMRGVAANYPTEIYRVSKGLPTSDMEDSDNWKVTNKPLDELRAFVSDFRSAKTDIEEKARKVRPWRRKG